MTQPIDVDLPHSLGKDEARRRIANNIHKLEQHIPGGAQVQSMWNGDQLNLNIAAMGEAVAATIDVMETKVHLKVLLPGMLGMFGGLVQVALQRKGSVLLEDHSKG
jgi:putative polyhydroxyalkanoate system protein